MSKNLISAKRNLDEVPQQPWRNGGGKTRELGQGAGWRVSVAQVEANGDFSLYPGWTRHSVVIAGAGLALRSGTAKLDLRPGAVTTYDGGLPWRSTLRSGTVQILNVMVQAHLAQARVEVAALHADDEPLSIGAGQFQLLSGSAPVLTLRTAACVVMAHILSPCIKNRDAELKAER